jgi:4-alpha-glucanotransferase
MDDVTAVAREWGIEPGYHDVFGAWHPAPVQTVQKVMAALSAHGAQPIPFPPARQPEAVAFQGDGRRLWGLSLQLYSVRSVRNWGIGDFADLREVARIAAASGAAAIGINPLHALFLDRAEMASPYAPSSRLFLNPLYIAVDAIEEFDGNAVSADDIAAARAADLVDYPRVAAFKLAALRRAYDRFVAAGSPARREDFAHFRIERGESLLRLGCYEVLRRKFASKPWWEWPRDLIDPDVTTLKSLRRQESDCAFYEFLQWIADRQLMQCKETARECGMPLGLYIDLAVGADPCGLDTWADQNAVLVGLCIGAPPDEFNRAGQEWGLAPFNPHALPGDDFAVIRKLLRAVMRHAGVIRLDHVLGLMRQFIIPHGAPPSEGVYIRFPFEALLDVIAEESNRYRCLVIGEDLGTVPDGFREAITRRGLWTYRVMQFERWNGGEFKSPSEYPAQALAAFNTHDLPTFRGWLLGKDIAVRRGLGLHPGEDEEIRAQARRGLRDVFARFSPEIGHDRFAAAAGFLADTPSRLITVAIEDLLDVAEQVNVPGTSTQYPNWCRKLPIGLEDWAKQPDFRQVVEAFERKGRAAR